MSSSSSTVDTSPIPLPTAGCAAATAAEPAAVANDWPAEVELVLSALEAACPANDDRRQYPRLRHRVPAELRLFSDTAGSAREIAERGDKTCAAIATRLAAEIYGLDILTEDVEDEAHNTTRFIVLSRDKKWAQRGPAKVVTTLVFRVRNVPAALYKGLGGFATNGINMTKLESYMIDGNFFATQFYVDVEGHPDERHERHRGARPHARARPRAGRRRVDGGRLARARQDGRAAVRERAEDRKGDSGRERHAPEVRARVRREVPG